MSTFYPRNLEILHNWKKLFNQ